MQHIRQAVCELRQVCTSQKQVIQLTGDGQSSGQLTLPLQIVVKSLLSVAASLVAVAGANATGLVSHAQPCAVANVKCSFSVIFDHIIEIISILGAAVSSDIISTLSFAKTFIRFMEVLFQ